MMFDKYFIMQKELDDYIIKSKNLESKSVEDMISHMFCGLFSEINEVADATARNTPRENVLEELIDVYHFLLSVGYRSGVDKIINTMVPEDVFVGNHTLPYPCTVNLMDSVKAYKVWSNKGPEETHKIATHWIRVFSWIYSRVLGLGFKWADAEKMYVSKWQENKARQDRGY